jgi:hypothetical protein
MKAAIGGQLRVERDAHDGALTDHDGLFLVAQHDLDLGAHHLDARRSDEKEWDGLGERWTGVGVRLEAVDLSTPGVTRHPHVEPAEALLGR